MVWPEVNKLIGFCCTFKNNNIHRCIKICRNAEKKTTKERQQQSLSLLLSQNVEIIYIICHPESKGKRDEIGKKDYSLWRYREVLILIGGQNFYLTRGGVIMRGEQEHMDTAGVHIIAIFTS